MAIYVTSDLHLGHKNILRYTKRHLHYSDIENHDNQIIERINLSVTLKDDLYILGDVSFKYPTKLFESLKCRKIHVIPGNHDEWVNKNHRVGNKLITIESHIVEIKHRKETFVMSHYPLFRWNKGHYGSYMLHGHSHGNINYENVNLRRLDVGWDNFFRPITLDEVIGLKGNILVTPPHHNRDEDI